MPFELGGLDSSTVGSDSTDRESPILVVEPSRVRRSIGEEEVEDTTPEDGESSEDIEDELPSC